jgi:hypothetical protein
VTICHRHVEPFVETDTGREDTNLYFRRQYYLGRNLGIELHPVDRWAQFCISALSSAWEVGELLGVHNPDDAAIRTERARVLTRLKLGEPVLGHSVERVERVHLERKAA